MPHNYNDIDRLTWLKKRLRQLELHRRGPSITYSPVPAVIEAIKVYIYIYIYIYIFKAYFDLIKLKLL